jgi:hypothetical protein
LEPGPLLSCMNNACIGRMWNYICCPDCDYTWTLSLEPQATASVTSNVTSSVPEAKAASDSPEDPLNLERLFGEMDNFCSHILSLPGAATHPDIQTQIQPAKVSGASRKMSMKQSVSCPAKFSGLAR